MWVRRDAWYSGMGHWCVDYVFINEHGETITIPMELFAGSASMFKFLTDRTKPHPTDRPDPRPSTQSFKSWYVWIE